MKPQTSRKPGRYALTVTDKRVVHAIAATYGQTWRPVPFDTIARQLPDLSQSYLRHTLDGLRARGAIVQREGGYVAEGERL